MTYLYRRLSGQRRELDVHGGANVRPIYMGVSPTGRTITWNEVFIGRLVDGRIAETWGVVDVAAPMRQLGVTPGSDTR